MKYLSIILFISLFISNLAIGQTIDSSLELPPEDSPKSSHEFSINFETGQVYINNIPIEKLSDTEIRESMKAITLSIDDYDVRYYQEQIDQLLEEIDQLQKELEKCKNGEGHIIPTIYSLLAEYIDQCDCNMLYYLESNEIKELDCPTIGGFLDWLEYQSH